MSALRDPGRPPATLTVTVPFAVKLRGGRKLVVAPPGTEPWRPARHRIDNAMVKAIARAHRWNALIESGAYDTIADLAKAERINPSYLSRIIRLTLLAPDIVEAILDGRQPTALQLDDLLTLFPVEWEKQRAMFAEARAQASRASMLTCP